MESLTSAESHEAVSLSRSALMLSPCIYWAQPQAEWYDSAYDPQSKRDRGTEVHSLIHQGIQDHALPSVTPEQKIAHHALEWLHQQVSSTRLTSVQSEIAVSVNWTEDKAEVLQVSNREYPQRDGWQNGTADIVARYGNNGLYVGDWKTGDGQGWEEQVLSLLYGFLKAFEAQGLELPTEFMGARLKVTEEGVWPIEKAYTRNDLDLHADAMRMRWEEVNAQTVVSGYVPGIHCTQYYCPHLAYCGAIKGYVREIAMKDEKIHLNVMNPVLTDKPQSDTEAGGTAEILSAVKRQLKYYDEKLKAYVEAGGRVISGQWEWKKGSTGFRWTKKN